MSDERVPVATDEALAMLAVIEDYDAGGGPEPCVHSYRASEIGLIGAHWPVEKVRAVFEEYGVELAGEFMTAIGYGLAVIDSTSPVFFATKDQS